jgi:hypothetical protein
VLEEGETPTADQVTSASRKLNMLVKTWGKRYSLHLLQDVVLFQVLSQQSYLLGNAATDANWCSIDDYAQTTLSADAPPAPSVSLTSATGFATGDKIGIVLDSGAIQWTTATMSGTTATLGAVTTGAATSGNVVFGYTSRIVRPLRVVKDTIYRRDINNNDTPVQLLARTNTTSSRPRRRRGRQSRWPTSRS